MPRRKVIIIFGKRYLFRLTPHPNLLPKEKGLAAFPLQGTLAEPCETACRIAEGVREWGQNLTLQLEILKQVQYD